MKTSRSDVRRMMSEAVKQAGPQALWCGLKQARMLKCWARKIQRAVFGNTSQLEGGRLV